MTHPLQHPTAEQQQQLARMRAMRSMMRDDDPDIDAEAEAVFHLLWMQEQLTERRLLLRDCAIVALSCALILAVLVL